MGDVTNRGAPTQRPHAALELSASGDVLVVRVAGLVDERFAGFGDVGQAKAVVIDVSGMTRMTSFGVRQWLRAMDALPKTITDRYLLGCQMFFVDQLNMVLNFGGGAQVLTAMAPYACSSCGAEAGETIDLLTEHGVIARGGTPERSCRSCNAKLELDESPSSYFAFAAKYAASKLRPDVAQLLAKLGLYTSHEDVSADKPPKVIKLVQGAVSYFRIIGTLGSTFRSRPFIVGAEGEIVLDLSEVERFDAMAQHEWRRLVKGLASQVTSVTLVDISQDFLSMAPDSFAVASNVFVASVLVPYHCADCGRKSRHSYALSAPIPTTTQVCSTCGGTTVNQLPPQQLAALSRAASTVPPASAKLIARRDDMLSRALTDEKVAQAGDARSEDPADTILGNYKIIRKLSAGGMAEVFLANQIGIGGFEKPVALKRIQYQLLESRHLAVDMFLNEAKIAGRLAHPNIVQVLDVGQVGGALYLAMEYVRGKDLRDVIKMLQGNSELIPLPLACYIVREVAQALHFAYWSADHEGNRLSVVHRDVSPHNIILSFDGAVKLLDFGVAMSSVTEQDEPMVVGKWSYMSPEHTTKQIGHRSDLFSLGVVLYLLCSGHMPFYGPNPISIIGQIERAGYAPLTGLPPALINLVTSMLSANPEDRPQSGQVVASALADIMRTNRLECTSLDISAFLGTLFAYEVPVNTAADPAGDPDTIAMDMTTIRLAVGSSPTQAQATPSALMRVSVPTPLQSSLVTKIADADVSFSPPIPTLRPSPWLTVIWLGAAAVILVIVVMLLAR